MTRTYCNKCGSGIDKANERDCFSISSRIGYGSKYDGDSLELDLCYDCLDEILQIIIPKCKHNPIKSSDKLLSF